MNDRDPSQEEPEGATSTRNPPGQPPPDPAARLGIYPLLGPVGKGGMGMVYRAWHPLLKRPVAIKTLPIEHLDNPACVARFQREMEAIGKLDHPNLVRATDAGEDRGVHFLVMEFVEGRDASQLVRAGGPLPVADACEVVRQAALGLQHAHEHGLVHRDVKPSNLMVTPTGQVKVLDLGLALLRGTSEGSGELTASHHWMGTFDYMAPEQGQNAHRVDIRADVYSLGCTLYKLLTGQAPFAGSAYNNPHRKMEAHARETPPPLQQQVPDAPADLAAVLERMLAKDFADRYPTPGEVAAALAPFTAGCDLARLVGAAPAALPAEQRRAAGETGSLWHLTPTSSHRRPAPPSALPQSPPPDLPTPVPPPPPAPRRWVRAALAGCAVGVIGLGVALGAWRLRPRVDEGPAPPPPDPSGATATPALNTWHNLLDRAPVKLLWPGGALEPVLDRPQQRLLVSCEGLGLLGFGTAPAGGCKFQVGLSQTRWTGGIGVFLGYREGHEGGKTIRRYQRLELVSLSRRGPVAAPPRFGIYRVRAAFRQEPGVGWIPQDQQLALQPLPPLTEHEHILTVEVSKYDTLQKVLWDGQPLPILTRPPVNSSFGPGDHVGSFGVYLANATGVFSNARILFLDKD